MYRRGTILFKIAQITGWQFPFSSVSLERCDTSTPSCTGSNGTVRQREYSLRHGYKEPCLGVGARVEEAGHDDVGLAGDSPRALVM